MPLFRVSAVHRVVFIGLLALTLAPPASATTVLPLSLGDMVRESETIIVGTVVAAQARWLEGPRVIVTDCDVAVEDVLSGNAPATVKLTFWGGTIGAETQEIAGMPIPQAGERFVMFLRAGALAGEVAPTVGLYEGLLRVASDGTLSEAGGGRLRGSIAKIAGGGVNLTALSAYVRGNLATLRSTPPSALLRAIAAGRQDSAPPLAATAPAPVGEAGVGSDRAIAGPLGADSVASIPPPPREPTLSEGFAELAAPKRRPYYSSYGFADRPISVNTLPLSTTYAANVLTMMGAWNYYANIFQADPSPSSTYGWGNAVFDVAGFLTDAQLQSSYHRGWGTGVLAQTFLDILDDGYIREADIALRAGLVWTLQDEAVYSGTPDLVSFRHTMFHELGHMWGAEHYWDDLAQMGYPADDGITGFTLPYMDDAEGVRARYFGGTPRTDLSIQLYRWDSTFKDDNGTEFYQTRQASFPRFVDAGTDITVTDFTIANTGTTTIAAPTIEWYLTSARNFNGTSRYLGTTVDGPPLPRFTKYIESTVSATLHIPVEVPPGTYYLAAFIRGDGGAPLSVFPYDNNRAFSRDTIIIGTFCLPTVFPTSATINGYGQTGAVLVSANPNCMWTATTDDSWITVMDGSGSANGMFSYAVAPNTSGAVRTGSITLGSDLFTITQNAAPRSPVSDFDGDHSADMVIYKGDGAWAILKSSSGYTSSTTINWGGAGYAPVPGDYDGDGRIDPAVYETATGRWYALTSSSNFTSVISQSWGGPGYAPEPGDYDGDGRVDLGVYVRATGMWYVLKSSSGYSTSFAANWGGPVYTPVPGADFDGDGLADLVVYHEPSGNWYVLTSRTGYTDAFVAQLGGHGYTLVPGDYDGDGRTDFAVYERAAATWHILTSSSDFGSVMSVGWGGPGCDPVPADYDGDGIIDPAFVQRSTGNWYALQSTTSYATSIAVTGWSGGDVISSAIRVDPLDDVRRATDVDGDGRADLTVYNAGAGRWYTLTSSSNYASAVNSAWGGADYQAAPGDFDGDGRADRAVYRASTGAWSVLLSSTNFTSALSGTAGGAGYVAVAGDYDGDGKTDMAAYNTTTGNWYVLTSSTNSAMSINWGGAGYSPVPADFDGDGRTDLGVYQAASGTWYVLLSEHDYSSTLVRNLGGAGYVPVPGDYDGDARADLVVYNTTTGLWYGLLSGSGFTTTINVACGGTGYDPVRGDFDGDGRQDIAVYASASGLWYVRLSSAAYASVLSKSWGGSGYAPIASP